MSPFEGQFIRKGCKLPAPKPPEPLEPEPEPAPRPRRTRVKKRPRNAVRPWSTLGHVLVALAGGRDLTAREIADERGLQRRNVARDVAAARKKGWLAWEQIAPGRRAYRISAEGLRMVRLWGLVPAKRRKRAKAMDRAPETAGAQHPGPAAVPGEGQHESSPDPEAPAQPVTQAESADHERP